MTTSLEARCAKCGVTVAITDIRSNGYSFVMKPGLALVEICPIAIERKAAGKEATEDACPILAKAIEARIEQFRREQNS